MRGFWVILLGIAAVGRAPPTPPDDGYVHANTVYGCTGYIHLPHILLGKDFEKALYRTMPTWADPKDPMCWYERTPNIILLKAGAPCSPRFTEWTFTYDKKHWESEQTVSGVFCD